MERYAVVELADEATEALKLERSGEREEALRRLNLSINRNAPYISAQENLKYQARSDRMKNGMTESDRKQSHYDIDQQKRKKEEKEE